MKRANGYGAMNIAVEILKVMCDGKGGNQGLAAKLNRHNFCRRCGAIHAVMQSPVESYADAAAAIQNLGWFTGVENFAELLETACEALPAECIGEVTMSDNPDYNPPVVPNSYDESESDSDGDDDSILPGY